MNQATRTNVSVLGVLFGLSAFFHGFFEALQGNTPTENLIINAVGESQLMWEHGGEPAMALIPNFLISGIIAMVFSIALIVWSVFFMHKKSGPTIYLVLFIVLLLFGGGIAQIIFIPWFWLVATRINKPLNWWREKLSPGLKAPLSKTVDLGAVDWRILADGCPCNRFHWIRALCPGSGSCALGHDVLSDRSASPPSSDLHLWFCV